MKVYRVAPDIFDKLRIDSRANEAVFNKGGYAYYTWIGEVKNYKEENSIYGGLKEESLYFYLFPEDAIKCGPSFMYSKMARLIEYDIPEELVVANAGFGVYDPDDIALETAVAYSKLGDIEIAAYDGISDEEKEKMLLDCYQDSRDLQKHFYGIDMPDDREDIIKSHSFTHAVSVLRTCGFANVVKTDFLTGNMWGFVSDMKDKSVEYLKEKGMNLDYSSEGEERRDFIVRDIKELLNFKSRKEANRIIRERMPEYNKIYQKNIGN